MSSVSQSTPSPQKAEPEPVPPAQSTANATPTPSPQKAEPEPVPSAQSTANATAALPPEKALTVVPTSTQTVNAQRHIRGPLRYQITTSSPQLEAGTKFSIYTRITNPYDVPVNIDSVTTTLPVEFINVDALERAERKHKIVALIRSVQGFVPQESKFFGVFGQGKGDTCPAPARMSNEQIRSTLGGADLVLNSNPHSIRR